MQSAKTIANRVHPSVLSEKQMLTAAAISGAVIDYILMCVDSTATAILPLVTIVLVAGFVYRKRNTTAIAG